MKLSSIGVGPAFPKTPFITSSFKITADDQLVVIGCGPRVPEVIAKHGHSLAEVDVWIIPSFCQSMIGGLVEVAFCMRHSFQRKPTLMAPQNIIDQIIKTVMPTIYETSKKIGYKNAKIDDYFNVASAREIKIKQSDNSSYSFSLVPHSGQTSLSYALLCEEIGVFITGTKKFDKEWIEFYSSGCGAVMYDINTSYLNFAEEMHGVKTLKDDIFNMIWLYGYNLDINPKIYPEFNFLKPNFSIYDQKRHIPLIDKFGKQKLEEIKKRDNHGNS